MVITFLLFIKLVRTCLPENVQFDFYSLLLHLYFVWVSVTHRHTDLLIFIYMRVLPA